MTTSDKRYGKTRAFASPNAEEIERAPDVRAAAAAGCIVTALDSIVSVGHNVIHAYGGNRAAKEAAVEVRKGAATKGAASFVGGAVVALGTGPTMAAAAPVRVTIGNAVYVVAAYLPIRATLGSIRRRWRMCESRAAAGGRRHE